MTSNGQDTTRPRRTKTRRFLVYGAYAMVGLPLVGTALLFARMALGPINVTPLVRPFLPVTVISGSKKQPPVATLGLNRAYLEWNGLRDGFTSPVMLVLQDIAVKGPDRTVVDTVHEAHVTLDTLALLHGGIALRAVELEGVNLALRRGKNGAVGFDFDTPPSAGAGDSGSVDTAGLDRAVISHAIVRMNDQLTGTHWVASPLDATLHMASAQGKKGITGAVQFAVTGEENPDCHIEVKANSLSDTDGKGIVWHLATNAVKPASFSHISHDLQHIRTPIAVTSDVSFLPAPGSDWLMPGAMDLHADAQSGKVTAAGARYFLNGGSANITLRLDHLKDGSTPAHIIVHNITANLRNPGHPEDEARGLNLAVSGQVDATDLVNPTTVSGQVTADIPQVYFPDLVYYWPDKAAKGGKKWVTKNITDGMAYNLHTTVSLSSKTGWNGVDVSNIAGGLDAKGLTIYWLRPISPLRGMDAHMDVDGLDKLSIKFDHGYQLVDRAGKNVGQNGTGRIAAGPGSMDIVGLTKKDQTGIINTQLDGKLQDVMALLAEPRLHLLSRHPLDLRNPRGRAKLQLMLSLPLKDDVSIDDMEIKGHADITQASLDNVVAGRGVRRADIKLDATADGLSLAGHGVLGGLPSNISYSTDFRHVPPTGLLEQAHLTSRITPQTATAAGFATGDHFGGSADAVVDYRQYGDHHGLVDINLNLRNSQIRIPLWHKAPGRAAQANATLGLKNGQIVAVDRILATGPDLDVRGKARLRPNHAPQLIISSFRVANSTGHAMLELPQKGVTGSVIHVGVYADMLDLSPLVTGDPSDPKPTQPASSGYHVPEAATGKLHGPPGTAWAIDLTANTLRYNPDKPSLKAVKAYFEDNGQRLEKMYFAMHGPTPVSMTLTPKAAGRDLRVSIPDMGAFLSDFNILPDVEGGHAVLSGSFDDTEASAPFNGRITVTPFVLKKAPTALRMARNISFYGWLAAHKTSEFMVTHLVLPVTFKDGVLNIHDGRTGNNALGATLEGNVNLDKNSIDLHGTVVPIFAINKLPGKLPGIGWMFSPEKDGGLVAVTFGVAGQMSNPSLHINPYSIFLPGALRRIF